MNYGDWVEVDTAAGWIKVKDEQGTWHTYRKGGAFEEPRQIHIDLVQGGGGWSDETGLRSAPEKINVCEADSAGKTTRFEYLRE